MPVIRNCDIKSKPDWCNITAFGIHRSKKGESPNVELHYHDCNEYYFVIEGKIRVREEDNEYILEAGDVLCTPMGFQHSLLEFLEDSTILWLEDELKGQKRTGHLHK